MGLGYTNELEKLIAETLGEESKKEQNSKAGHERESSTYDQPGRLGIVEGQLTMEQPLENGAWPVILPSEGVHIFHKGQRITRPTVVSNVDDVTMSVETKQSKSEYKIVVSADKMEVVLKTRFTWGMEYRICDSDFKRKLRVKVEPVGELAPQAIDPEVVVSELKACKMEGRIPCEEITRACTGLKDVDVVILRGQPVQPPVDGRIEMLSESTSCTCRASTKKRIDHRNRKIIHSVDIGDVLAYWYPPQPGTAGKNVYGEVVTPRSPKNATFRAGRGVRLINDGHIAVAEKPGRPFLHRGTLSVEPRMVIQQDVDMSTGNIKFKGDVIVVGNVRESMEIHAGGMVQVMGSVYHANILSGSHVTIKHKLIGGRVEAGVHYSGLTRILAVLRKLIPRVRRLVLACLQLKSDNRMSAEDLSSHCGDGYLVKLVMEMRFPQIPKQFAELTELLANENLYEEGDDVSNFAWELQTIAKRFMCSGPLYIQSLGEVENNCTQLQDLGSRLEELLDNPADIVVNYCQNARLEATGSICVTGSLVYDCDMVAGDEIRMAGECRCGSYSAKSSISAGTVGSKGMGMTLMSVTEGGSISGQLFHPGVKIRIGAREQTTTTTCRNQIF